MKISEIITDKYKLRLPPTVYYDLLADVAEAEEEQEPKTGHWIDKFGGVYRCSCCREIISIDTEIEFPNGITYKYCPYCGSDNREVEE